MTTVTSLTTNYDAQTNTSDVEKIRTFLYRTLKVRQTTSNWVKRILNEAT